MLVAQGPVVCFQLLRILSVERIHPTLQCAGRDAVLPSHLGRGLVALTAGGDHFSAEVVGVSDHDAILSGGRSSENAGVSEPIGRTRPRTPIYPRMLRGSLPGAMVCLSRICPLRP